MKYRLKTHHENQKHLEEHKQFFISYGMDPNGVFEGFEGPSHTSFDKSYVHIKMQNYIREYGAFQKYYFVPAEITTDLEDWL